MTNEQLVAKIQAGETNLMPTLWEQVEKFTNQQAGKFLNKYYERCTLVGIALEDLQQEAYLGIHKAVRQYDANKGVKFLTYAGYHLMSRFYDTAKMHSSGWNKRQEPISLDSAIFVNDSGEDICLMDNLTDSNAEAEIDEAVNRDYMDNVRPILYNVLDRLPVVQRETAILYIVSALACPMLNMHGVKVLKG